MVPVEQTNTFAGLRSRWTTPAALGVIERPGDLESRFSSACDSSIRPRRIVS